MESVRGGFTTLEGSRVDNLRVLLVDDVMTAGVAPDANRRQGSHRFDGGLRGRKFFTRRQALARGTFDERKTAIDD
jgi:hypothetical protein